ncbi:oxidase ustYa family protein [Aspergillus stella-maris]|uniref:oxidase ustYa family protein n=1 Tax=Aspergillus stella-maris TaxID=1810926 RepID=UPI003CCC952F
MLFSEISHLFQKKRIFHALKTERPYGEDEEGLLAGHECPRKQKPSSACSTRWIFFTCVNIAISTTAVGLILSKKGITSYQDRNEILRPVSWWSPVLDDIEVPRHEAMLNGTLFALPEISIAREEPGPENDERWHQFEKVLTHVVSREEIIKLGKNPDTVSRFDNEYWYMGDNAYMVQLDVMHQIHCLNLLRKAAFEPYPNYKPTPPLDTKDKHWWIHLGHCTDILLQNIQCNANTEVLTLNWVEDRHPPWPDFSINRKCGDWEALVQWQRDHAVDVEMFEKMPLPKDAFVWPAPWKNQDFELGVELGRHYLQEGGF